MTKEDEILSFLEGRMFVPILNSPNTSDRLKKATRGLRLRLKQRNAQEMIQYFWNNVVDTQAKHATYGRILYNERFSDFEEVINDFRLKFKEI